MSSLRAFKQKLAAVTQLWQNRDYERALAEVEKLRESWPGNAHLAVLWANLVQLQDDPTHSLEEAKEALQAAKELDPSSPSALIELGHFLDAVEDKPGAAAKAYGEATDRARRLLLESLIGQARAFLQVGQREEALANVREILNLLSRLPNSAMTARSDARVRARDGRLYELELKGPYADQIEALLSEVLAERTSEADVHGNR